MAPVPQASGKEAVGCWARAVASSTTRCVRRRSPNSASANSCTAQGVSSRRPRMLDSYGHRLRLGRAPVLNIPQEPWKIKIVSIWQYLGGGDAGPTAAHGQVRANACYRGIIDGEE